MDEFGKNGLSCPKITEHYTEISNILRDCLNTVRIDHYELSDYNESNRNSSEDTKLTPWRCGQPLVWDITVVDTFAPRHSSLIKDGPGALANRIEKVKTVEQH